MNASKDEAVKTYAQIVKEKNKTITCVNQEQRKEP